MTFFIFWPLNHVVDLNWVSVKFKGSFFLFFPGDDPASSSRFEHWKANDLIREQSEFIGDHRQLADKLEGLLRYINDCWHKAATADIHNIAHDIENHRCRFIELFGHFLRVIQCTYNSATRKLSNLDWLDRSWISRCELSNKIIVIGTLKL